MTDSFYAGGGIGLGPRPPAAPVTPYPAPLVRSTDGVPGPVKTAVTGLVKLAEAAGWTVRVTYAKGWMPNTKTGRPGKAPKETLAVRMERGTERAVAVYAGASTWAWDTMMRWTIRTADQDGVPPRKYGTLGPFKEAIQQGAPTETLF